MKKLLNVLWCILLLLPAVIFYLLLLIFPQNLNHYFVQSMPLTIVMGLTVMLWVVCITFSYTYYTIKTKKTDDSK